MKTLSLSASKKMFELVGEYGTESTWSYDSVEDTSKPDEYGYKRGETVSLCYPGCDERCMHWRRDGNIPAPNFAELVRVLPKIGEKKGWKHGGWHLRAVISMHAGRMMRIYLTAPTEPEGMAKVEEYLMKLL